MTKMTKSFKNKLIYSSKNNDLYTIFDNVKDEIESLIVIENIREIEKTTKVKNISKTINLDNFYLKKTIFSNYKKINNLELDFHEKLTVIIGSNGVGKTSILNGIVKNISWIVNNILKYNNNGSYILENEISNNVNNILNKISSVKCDFMYGNNTKVDGELVKHLPGFPSKRQSKLTKYKKVGEIIRKINIIDDINLPLFAFYSVKRFSDNVGNIELKKNIDKLDIYKNILDGNIKFDTFISWLLQCLKIQSSYPSLEGYRQRLAQIIEAKNILVPDTEVFSILEREENKLNEFINDIENSNNFSLHLIVINNIVKNVFKSFKKFTLEQRSGFDEIFLVFENNEKININQLSDGERVFIAILMDIAYRLILLNPERKNPLEGTGIVIIDEIELHLHPRWQQDSIILLQQNFPNLQFIITTHSPHVLSTVDSNSIRILKSDNTIHKPELQTKGVISSDILERIMFTSAVPPIFESELLEKIINLIDQNDFENQETDEILSKLKKHFGNNHPEMIKVYSKIELMNLKNKYKKSFNK
ncbi:AAA family ATPase [Acinetobacter guillouiae]|uniref:AAA family ATPase n=1 Tax=Acinetobacter guillouiae TaxID=106649 RepID=UPI001CD7A168|nr:AAA family ATPase [Acinetobacter guillouiae]